jgi:hypothetical protein
VALDEVSLLIATSAGDEFLRAARNQLLVQVGLEEITADWQYTPGSVRRRTLE